MKVLIASAAGAVALALAPMAPAQTLKLEQPNTFAGQCDYAGTIDFRDPLGPLSVDNRMRLSAQGSCSGILDGQPVDAPASLSATASGPMSCTQALPLGQGELVVAGAEISFAFSEVRVLGAGKVEFVGRAGGSLEGTGVTDEDPALLAQRCLPEGQGVHSVGFTGRVAGAIAG